MINLFPCLENVALSRRALPDGPEGSADLVIVPVNSPPAREERRYLLLGTTTICMLIASTEMSIVITIVILCT